MSNVAVGNIIWFNLNLIIFFLILKILEPCAGLPKKIISYNRMEWKCEK